jgi:chromosome segregation ATPase
MSQEKTPTVSFRVDNEVKEKLTAMIGNGRSKEWMEKAIALMEIQSVKETSSDFASDLSEVEVHTKRIFEALTNIVNKSQYLKDDAVRTLETALEQQRQLTSDYQVKNKDAQDQRDQALAQLETSVKEQADLVKQVEELRSTLETNKLLVSEYQQKNDSLNGLIAKFEGYATENEELKKALSSERHSHQAKIDKLTQQSNEQTATIKDLGQQMDRLKEAHETAVQRLQERLNVEHERAMLKTEREHQKALIEANNVYTEKLKGLYDDRDNQRQSYEQKIAELERQLNAERTKNNKSK